MTLSNQFHSRLLSVVMLLIVAFSVIGCGPPKYTDYKDFLKSPRPIVAGKPYVIEPPDTLNVIAPSAPEINGARLQVRSDGFVTLHLIGDIFAAGKTPTQLGAEIEEKILKYYQDVSVQVQLGQSNSKFYYMYGETSAGPKRFTGKDSVLHVVLSSGLPGTSWPSKAVLIRPNERAELVRRMSIDLTEMLETGDLKHNVVIEEGDIFWIPINPFAMIGRVLSNILQPVDPVIQAYTAPGNTYRRADRAYDNTYNSNNNNRR